MNYQSLTIVQMLRKMEIRLDELIEEIKVIKDNKSL